MLNVCIPPTENVEDKEMPPIKRHAELQVQPQPGSAEENQGTITLVPSTTIFARI